MADRRRSRIPQALSFLTNADTKRKRAEEALRESEELHRITLGNISDAVFITDDAGAFTYICPNVGVIFGHSFDEVRAFGNISRLLGDGVFNPAELEGRGEIANIDREITDKAGSSHALLVNVKRVSIKEGTLLYTCRDITEHKRAEAALWESEERARAIIETAYDAFISMDADGVITAWNAQAETIFGWSRSEAVGRKLADTITPPRHREAHQAGLELFMASGNGSMLNGSMLNERIEITAIHRDGHEFPVELAACPAHAGETSSFNAFIHDITERKQAEETLRESEERFRNVLQVSRDLIYKLNLVTGSFDYVSPSVLPLTGFSPEEFVALGLQGVADRFHPETRARVQAALDNLPNPDLEAGEVPEVEYRWKRKDGRYRWFRDNRSLIRDEQGRATSIVSVVTDITERKQAEETLRASEEKFRLLAEHAQDVILRYRFTEPVGYEYVSPAVAAISGYAPADWYENPHFGHEIVHPDDQQVFEQMLNELHAGPYELRWICKDGTVIWTGQNTTPIHDDSGKLVAVEGVIRDITERKQAEVALRASEERFRVLAENAQDMVYRYRMTEPRGYDFISPSATTISGYTPEEFYAEPFLMQKKIIHPDDREALEQLLRDVPTDPVELRWIRKDGAVVWTERRTVPIYDDSGELVALEGIIRDITERKRAEETLRVSEARFRRLYTASPAMLQSIDPESRLLNVSDRWLGVLGYERSEVIGRGVVEFLTEESRRYVEEVALPDFWKRGAARDIRLQFVRKDGEIVDILLSAIAEYDKEGNPKRTLAVLTDVTEQKRLEEQLQCAREELEGKVERQMLRKNPYGLTFRELVILHPLVAGRSDKEIATELVISPQTVHKHVANILSKMDAASRTEAATRALREGLLE